MGQTLGPCPFIEIASILVLVTAFALGIKISDLAYIVASFFEDKYSFSRFMTDYFALKHFTFGKVDGELALELVIAQ